MQRTLRMNIYVCAKKNFSQLENSWSAVYDLFRDTTLKECYIHIFLLSPKFQLVVLYRCLVISIYMCCLRNAITNSLLKLCYTWHNLKTLKYFSSQHPKWNSCWINHFDCRSSESQNWWIERKFKILNLNRTSSKDKKVVMFFFAQHCTLSRSQSRSKDLMIARLKFEFICAYFFFLTQLKTEKSSILLFKKDELPQKLS